MIDDSKIVVLLAAYNGGLYIEEQIKSILNKSIKPTKIIVSIDKSDDNTLLIVRSFQKKFKEIEILSFRKKFGSSTANFFNLILNSKLDNFDFVALSDQDDIWKIKKLERSISSFDSNTIGYSSNVEAFWQSGKIKKIKKNQTQSEYDYLFESAGPACTYVMKIDFVNEFKGFLKDNIKVLKKFKYYHDWLIYAFARSRNYKWLIGSDFGLMYRQHRENDFGVNYGFKAYQKRVISLLNGSFFNTIKILINLLKLRNNIFVAKWFPYSRFGFLYLTIFSYKCRRKNIDIIFFSLVCLYLSIFFPKFFRKDN